MNKAIILLAFISLTWAQSGLFVGTYTYASCLLAVGACCPYQVAVALNGNSYTFTATYSAANLAQSTCSGVTSPTTWTAPLNWLQTTQSASSNILSLTNSWMAGSGTPSNIMIWMNQTQNYPCYLASCTSTITMDYITTYGGYQGEAYFYPSSAVTAVNQTLLPTALPIISANGNMNPIGNTLQGMNSNWTLNTSWSWSWQTTYNSVGASYITAKTMGSQMCCVPNSVQISNVTATGMQMMLTYSSLGTACSANTLQIGQSSSSLTFPIEIYWISTIQGVYGGVVYTTHNYDVATDQASQSNNTWVISQNVTSGNTQIGDISLVLTSMYKYTTTFTISGVSYTWSTPYTCQQWYTWNSASSLVASFTAILLALLFIAH